MNIDHNNITVDIVIADMAAIEMQEMQILAFLHYSYCVPKSVYPTKKLAKCCELHDATRRPAELPRGHQRQVTNSYPFSKPRIKLALQPSYGISDTCVIFPEI